MAASDHWTYWNAMAPLRAARPKAPPLPMKAASCPVSKLAPKHSMPAWFVLDADAAALRTHVFPAQFFRWCQEYVTVALTNRPSKDASAKARVFWALDVWTRVVQGMLTANVPFDDRFEVLEAYYRVMQASHVAGVADLDEETRAALRAAGVSKLGGRDLGVVAPGPFADLPWVWLRRRPGLAKRLYALAPWTDTFDLPRKDNADADDLKGADAPTRAALLQWRLWTMQELEKPDLSERRAWFPTGVNPGFATRVTDYDKAAAYDRYWPMGMGKRSNSGSLADYVRWVASERAMATVESHTPWYYPNFAWSYTVGVPSLGNYLTQLDYDAVIQARMHTWIVEAVPRVDAAGKAVKGEPQPVTCTDYALAYDGKADQIRAAAKDAEQRAAGLSASAPKLASQVAAQVASALQKVGTALAALELSGAAAGAAAALGSVGTALGSVAASLAAGGPFAAVSGAAGAGVAWLLLKIGGVAVGHFYIPIEPIPQPFVRTLRRAEYNTQATGSSADVLLRVVNAFVNIERSTGLDLGFVFKPTLSARSSLRKNIALRAAAERAAALRARQALELQDAIREGRLVVDMGPADASQGEGAPTVVVEGTPGGVLVRAIAFTGNPFRLFSRERRT